MKTKKNEQQFYELKMEIDDELVYQVRKYLPEGVSFPKDPNDKFEMPDGFEFIDEVIVNTLNSGTSQNKATTHAADSPAAVEAGLGAIRTAWAIIEKGTPLPKTANLSSAILNKADMDWTHYSGAKIFESKELSFTLDQFLFLDVPSICLAKARYTIDLSYDAAYTGPVTNVAKGKYIPNISVTVLESYNAVGTWLNMNAEISNVTNIGQPGKDVVPHFYLTLQFEAKKTMSSGSWTNKITVQGDVGITSYGTQDLWIEQW